MTSHLPKNQSKHTCVIIQSSYIPWRGYFDLINKADTFIFLDQVQFTRRDWRTRNRIPTAQGLRWLSVPVTVDNCFSKKIYEVEIDNKQPWGKIHFKTLSHAYAKAKFKDQILEELKPIYLDPPKSLSKLNRTLTIKLWDLFSGNKEKKFIGDESFELDDNLDSNQRLINLCKKVSATHYLSGPSAASYLDLKLWEQNQISVEFVEYSYPEYEQLHSEMTNHSANPSLGSNFEGAVSIIDVLMNLGTNSLTKALT
jgi:WbqC-like protein family